jgi:hypothetical protein
VEAGMGDAYDIFMKDNNDDPVWVETVIGLHQVKKRLMKLSALKPANYLVYDPTERRFIEPFRKSA